MVTASSSPEQNRQFSMTPSSTSQAAEDDRPEPGSTSETA